MSVLSRSIVGLQLGTTILSRAIYVHPRFLRYIHVPRLTSCLIQSASLKKTLDYLLHTLLPTYGLAATYAFIRDRTRAIRTDFVIQHVKDATAIECFERIARFHILAVHVFCEPEGRTREADEPIRGFDYRLEVEQMMKSKCF
jgi:hypothetical protein